MDESTVFGASAIGLVVALVAEHLIRDKAYYKGTFKEKASLYAVRALIAILAFSALGGMPNFASDGACHPDPESQYPASECN